MKLSLIFFFLLVPAAQKEKSPVKPSDLKEWVSFLASDKMKGRGNGSGEMEIAAKWIALKFGEYGLKPVRRKMISGYSYVTEYSKIRERNVIGLLEGSDPLLKNEYLVLSAHFDHLGIGKAENGDTIYNGADDNAAGTATLIGIAKYINDSGARPGRSIIFCAFSGEEDGMRGSRHFVANLPVPAKKIFANMNFELTGHSEELGRGHYYMTGCSLSSLDEIVKGYATRSGLVLVDTIPLTNMLFNASDNISFSRMSVRKGISKGVPSGTFATSTLAWYLHTPADEVELFDFENMAMLVNHFADAALKLSARKGKVEWTDAGWMRP